MATVMRAPTDRQRRRIIDEAYEVGIRHFDAAPSYGAGEAESLLSGYIRRHSDIVVATKVGIQLSSGIQRFAGLQAPARHLARSVPGFRKLGQSVLARNTKKPELSAQFLERSLTSSLKRLGRDSCDLLLLHEVDERGVSGIARDWLDQSLQKGRAREIGWAASGPQVPELDPSLSRIISVAQVRADLSHASTMLPNVPNHILVYGAVSAFSAAAVAASRSDMRDYSPRRSDRSWGAITAVKIAHLLYPSRLILVGSATPGHLTGLVTALESGDDEPREILQAMCMRSGFNWKQQ